jgi:uncharacterized protein YndB with AHSA1/START domain
MIKRPGMPTFASELFRAVTHAKPERVWDALTAADSPLGYLLGMRIESDWQPGSAVTLTVSDEWRLTGDVLAAERPRRLSYTLGDQPGEPSAYVSWELRAAGDVTIIRLYVDEPWPDPGASEDLEIAWLRVLSGLVSYLERHTPAQPGTTGE